MKRARPYALLLLSGGALSLAFPEPDIAPLAWVAIVPLILLSWGAGVRRGALMGFTFGLSFFGGVIWFFSIVGVAAWAFAIVIEAAFIALFGAAWGWLSRRIEGWAAVPVVAALWVAAEFFRTYFPFGGFTWGELAQSQHDLRWMLRPAAYGGAWLVAFLVVGCNAALALALRSGWARRSLASLAPVGLAVVLIAAPALLPAPSLGGKAIRIGIVQGDVPFDIPRGVARDLAIIDSHRQLTESLADDEVDLVLWPESSVAVDLEDFPEAPAALFYSAQAAGAPMIVGANHNVGDENFRVVAHHVGRRGEVVDTYVKTHLVPFGEYIPFRSLLDWIPQLEQIPRDALAGDEVGIFDVAGGRVAPVISFEADFGPLVRRRIADGARLLTVSTNTSTWEHSWASAQHLAFSQVRAAENGVWVAHAAISGISGVIAPDGRVVERTGLFEATTIVADARFAEGATFYARTGEWFALLCALASAGAIAFEVIRRRRVGE